MTCARVVFAGTPDFAVPCLEVLHDLGVEIAAVYCQPDRPSGRGRVTRACAVKRRALELGLDVRQPATLRDPVAVESLRGLSPDLMVVAAYGLLLPAAVLDAPRLGCVNVHASLLPRWRGAAPIQRAIEAGDERTGITLMQMDAGLDTGPMLARVETAIEPDDTGGTLHDRLSQLGAKLLGDKLPGILSGDLKATPQPDEQATYASKIERDEGLIQWSGDVAAIERKIRAFNPWPVCWTTFANDQIRIWRASAIGNSATGERPGTIVSAGPDGIDVVCDGGVLRIHELQRPGGKRLGVADFLNGAALRTGQVLGAAEPAVI
jgi:methionyl-tRNA formyltransferase